MTMTANEVVAGTNDRMPVLLTQSEYDFSLHGSIKEVIGFQFRDPVAPDRMMVTPTRDLWRGGGLPLQPQFGLQFAH